MHPDNDLDLKVANDIKGLYGLEGVVSKKSNGDAILSRFIKLIKFYNDGTIQEIEFIYLEEE